MKFNRNPLSNAVKNGLSSALVLGLASSPLAVLAQDDADGEDGVELDRVQVTGSRIKPTDVVGTLPVMATIFPVSSEPLQPSSNPF